MAKRRTHEEFVEELKLINPNIEVLGFFTTMKTKIKVRCKICGRVWSASPANLLNGTTCLQCYHQSLIKTLDRILIELEKKHPGKYEYIGGFTKASKKCWWKCKICGFIFMSRPSYLLNKAKCCPNCKILNKFLTEDEVRERIRIISDGKIEYVSGYVNTKTKCKWRCTICVNEFESIPYSMFRGKKCPICGKKSIETPVLQALLKKGIVPSNNEELKDCCFPESGSSLRPDFYIKTKKGILWIETDGHQHFAPINGYEKLKEQQKRDLFKNEYCKKHGICLIRVTSSSTKEWGTEKHITLAKLLQLIEIGIDSETKEINFDLFWQYDFNRE